MAQKWVYLFSEGTAQMRDLLGGKGAGVAEMTRAGLPVSPGFTITTEACNAYYKSEKQLAPGVWEQAMNSLRVVEHQTGRLRLLGHHERITRGQPSQQSDQSTSEAPVHGFGVECRVDNHLFRE